MRLINWRGLIVFVALMVLYASIASGAETGGSAGHGGTGSGTGVGAAEVGSAEAGAANAGPEDARTVSIAGADAGAPARIAIYPIVKAPVGASQDYLILSTMRSVVVGGDVYSPELDPVEEAFSVAVHARYTVLEPDGEVGRLGVEAIALDHETRLPLVMPAWSGVLRLPPSEEVWEDGNSPDWAYELGVALDWLREWLTSPEDAPQGPIAVGDVWRAAALIDENPQFAGLETMRGAFEVTGEYQEIVRPGEGAPLAAQVHEAYTGRFEDPKERMQPPAWCVADPEEGLAFEDYLRWIEECLEYVVTISLPTAMDVEGFMEVLMVEGDFPWSGKNASTATVIFARDDAPEMTLEFASDIVRYDAPFVQGGVEWLRSGEVLRAHLGADSWSGVIFGAPAGAPADLYTFWGEEGDGVLIEMSSDALAPYVVLMDSDWNAITESFSFFDERAEVFATLPYTGVYLVQATTTSGWTLGEYQLSLQVGPEVTDPRGDAGDWDGWEWDSGWEFTENFGWEYDPVDDLMPVYDVQVYDMSACAAVPLGHEEVWVIGDDEALLNAFRADAAELGCFDRLEAPDFDRYVLVGVGIDSGWCGGPSAFTYEVWRDELWGDVLIFVDYPAPRASQAPCEDVSPSQLWLLVERPPSGVTWGYYAYAEPYIEWLDE